MIFTQLQISLHKKGRENSRANKLSQTLNYRKQKTKPINCRSFYNWPQTPTAWEFLKNSNKSTVKKVVCFRV